MAPSGERDAGAWESGLSDIANWGPAEDWTRWAMKQGEIWFAATLGRSASARADPVADRVRSGDGVPSECVIDFDNLQTSPRAA
ncbi:MAG TPA: hypothetical protein VHX88_01245 [Solirubrobacteraceae bacterium]|nr:hypothetical protein [Solirubrobacteraceae bacterium]